MWSPLAARLSADVSSRESLIEARDKILASFGHIDILVNSAGRIKLHSGARHLSEEE